MIETKIAIVIKDDLLPWQKMNVAAFLASAVAVKHPATHGKEFVNASGSEYLPFINQPVFIYQANSSNEINRSFRRARDRDLSIGIYTDPLFTTNNEAANLEAIAKESDESQDLVGIIIYGERKLVNKAVNGLKFHD